MNRFMRIFIVVVLLHAVLIVRGQCSNESHEDNPACVHNHAHGHGHCHSHGHGHSHGHSHSHGHGHGHNHTSASMESDTICYSSGQLLLLSALAAASVSFVSLCGMLLVMWLGDSVLFLQLPLVSFGGASMLASSLLIFLPESVEHNEPFVAGLVSLIGALSAILVETLIHYFVGHGHSLESPAESTPADVQSSDSESLTIDVQREDDTRHIVYPDAPISTELKAPPTHLDRSLNALAWNCLIGDALHNLVDGILVGTTVTTAGPVQGALVTVIIVLHELPQEVAELCILLQAGWPMRKALMRNALSTTTCLLGSIAGASLGSQVDTLEQYCIPFICGQFLYVSLGQLMPSLSRLSKGGSKLGVGAAFTIGLLLTYAMTYLAEDFHSHSH